MVFKPTESGIYQSVFFQRRPLYKTVCILTPLFLIATPFLAVLAFASGQAVVYLFLAIVMGSLMPLTYFRLAFSSQVPEMTLEGWKQTNETENIALAMGETAIGAVVAGTNEAKKSGKEFSPYFLIHGLLGDPDGIEIISRLGLVGIKDMLAGIGQDEGNWDAVLAGAVESAMSGGQYIEAEDLVAGLYKGEKAFQSLVSAYNLDDKAVVEIVSWHKRIRGDRKKKPFWLQPVVGGVGKDWSYGYTLLLQRYALNLTKTEMVSQRHVEIFSKMEIVATIERILARSGKNNVLLVGEHGIGKKTIIKALARKIVDGQVHEALRYKEVMQVNVGALLAGTSDQGEIVGRINGMLAEAARAGNIILFIDDIHALLSAKNSVGTVNAAEVMMPYLTGSRVQIIGTTTTASFHEDIEAAAGIGQAFERIDVPIPDKTETLKVLEETIPYLEYRYKVIFIYQTLKAIVELSDRYMHDKEFPQKAIDLADEAAVKASSEGRIVVAVKDIEEIVGARTHVPVGEAETSEKEKLLKLEEVLHKRVIGQDEAIKAVADALRRARSGLASKNRPLGTFLFIGPTGVGKTETAKALAEAYFGSEGAMIRFDMSEYQDAGSVYRLIGAPPAPGAEAQPGQMTTQVHDRPFSLLLLDELEKTHPNILTLFLQVFDDGRLTASDGKVVDFTNTIIIATSNAGSEVIRQYVSSGQSDINALGKMLINYLQEKGIYKPEFINRFDGVITYKPLSMEEIKQVAALMIDGLNKQLAEKQIKVEVAADGMDYLVERGYDPAFGARPMRRMIQNTVENALAKKLLGEDVAKGTVITLGAKELSEAAGTAQNAQSAAQ